MLATQSALHHNHHHASSFSHDCDRDDHEPSRRGLNLHRLPASDSTPRQVPPVSNVANTTPPTVAGPADDHLARSTSRNKPDHHHHHHQLIPSPPSSSPAASAGPKSVPDHALTVPMASTVPSSSADSLIWSQSQSQSHHRQQQPSPPTDNNASISPPTPSPTTAAKAPVTQPDQVVVHIRDLAHIKALARAENATHGGILDESPAHITKYEISEMPIGDVIEMVAALLDKMTTANDLQHDAVHRNSLHQQQAGQSSESSQMSPLSHSVLAFHGKNVPAITILNYLARVHKYCPTTYEVFLSLLVYFDRMTERVNDMVTRNEQFRRSKVSKAPAAAASAASAATTEDVAMADDSESLADSDDDSDSELGGADDDESDTVHSSKAPSQVGGDAKKAPGVAASEPLHGAEQYFVVDSFNIHRLIIAGITCASKFFSDVFYTNSRYAKVGGLPQAELNHLEIQFLVLNDFRLMVPVEDLEAYGTMLVEFYARDVVSREGA